ncbi:MAG: SGNH/GDSL hydrolase family protein [Candidatus Coatesbacteria bacterium]|nr:SGNH/GDSL hydrolase family protein [Candidatus Coatesbacteria bacterium]
MDTRSKVRRAAANLLLLLVSLSISLVGAEIVIRFIEWRNSPVSPKLFYEHDDVLGWRKVPGKEGWLVKPEYKINEKINSKGLRGPECPYEKPQGEFRILVLGDSFTEGYSVQLASLFTQVLAEKLNNEGGGGRFRVINAGTSGYSTDQELLFFRQEGVKYGPDLVLLMFYENDVWYNNQARYWRGYKPLFCLEGESLVLTNVPVPKPEPESESDGGSADQRLTLKQWLNRNSRIYAFLRSSLKRIGWLNAALVRVGLAQKPSESAPIPEAENGQEDASELPDEFEVWRRRPTEEMQQAWAITEALIRQLKREVEESGANLIVFYIPNKATIYDDSRKATMQKYSLSEDAWDLDKTAKDLQQLCDRLSVQFVDPTEVFREEARRLEQPGERLYYTYDNHWNPHGHRLAADILSDLIEAGLSND